MALTARITTKVQAEQTSGTDNTTGVATLGPNGTKEHVLASGTGADQADRMWSDRRTVNASTTDSIDLSGALTDAFGATVTFAKVKVIQLINRSTTQTLTLQRPAANGVPIFAAASDAVAIPPGGSFTLAGTGANGLAAVTAGTGDLVDVVNGAGAAADYDIVVIGTSV